MFGRLGILNAFSTNNIFNLHWVCQDVTPSQVEEDLQCANPRQKRLIKHRGIMSVSALLPSSLPFPIKTYFYQIFIYPSGVTFFCKYRHRHIETFSPTVGQNHLTPSLYHNKVLNISCNLLNTVLKVKTGMVVWVQNGRKYGLYRLHGVFPLRITGLSAACHRPASRERIGCISLARETIKVQNSKYGFY